MIASFVTVIAFFTGKQNIRDLIDFSQDNSPAPKKERGDVAGSTDGPHASTQGDRIALPESVATPHHRFRILGEVVEDIETNYMWPRSHVRSWLNWFEATSYCTDLNLGGYSDWRLPSASELKTLFDPSVEARYKSRGAYQGPPFQLHGSVDVTYYCCFWSTEKDDNGAAILVDLVFKSEMRKDPQASGALLSTLCIRGR